MKDMNAMNNRVGAWFRDLRVANRLTQREAAERMCVTQAHISKLELGQRPWTPALLALACRALGVSERTMFEALARAA